jgi:putative restriction endonuclease
LATEIPAPSASSAADDGDWALDALRGALFAVDEAPLPVALRVAVRHGEVFTRSWVVDLIVDLDPPEIESAAATHGAWSARRRRHSGFTEEVLRAYAYACGMCGFDGRLGRHPVAIQAAHVRWHSQGGPDEVANALALCVLHHALLDLGVLGLTEDLRVRVSTLYVANSEAGRTVDDLAGRPLLTPRPGKPRVKAEYITWHERQVFKGGRATAA